MIIRSKTKNVPLLHTIKYEFHNTTAFRIHLEKKSIYYFRFNKTNGGGATWLFMFLDIYI